MTSSAILSVTGTAVALRGDDVDTDRIIPARFLKAITFEGLGAHAFEDDRKALGGAHPFDRPGSEEAAVLLVNRNFGCGSSREHAPQALLRRGVRAIVGEGFSEIFSGNAVLVGMPCVRVSAADARALQDLAEREPALTFTVDLSARTVTAEGVSVPFAIPEGVREAFVSGRWDGLSLLLERLPAAREVAARLPYGPPVPTGDGPA